MVREVREANKRIMMETLRRNKAVIDQRIKDGVLDEEEDDLWRLH